MCRAIIGVSFSKASTGTVTTTNSISKHILATMAGSLRGEKVAYLAEKLYNNLVDGDQNRIALSGVLSPTNSLRHKDTRERFSWVQHEFSGERLFTQAMIRDAIAKMALDKSIFLVVPQTPGFSEKTWIEDQAKAIHALLKKVAGLELCSGMSVDCMFRALHYRQGQEVDNVHAD